MPLANAVLLRYEAHLEVTALTGKKYFLIKKPHFSDKQTWDPLYFLDPSLHVVSFLVSSSWVNLRAERFLGFQYYDQLQCNILNSGEANLTL